MFSSIFPVVFSRTQTRPQVTFTIKSGGYEVSVGDCCTTMGKILKSEQRLLLLKERNDETNRGVLEFGLKQNEMNNFWQKIYSSCEKLMTFYPSHLAKHHPLSKSAQK